jgi:hypothetical protein
MVTPTAPEDVAEAFTRLALETPGDEPFSFLRLPHGVILDIIELFQEAYVVQEEPTDLHALMNLRL